MPEPKTIEERIAALEQHLAELNSLIAASYERVQAMYRGEFSDHPVPTEIPEEEIAKQYDNIFQQNMYVYDRFLQENRKRDMEFYLRRVKERSVDEPRLPTEFGPEPGEDAGST